MLFCKQHAMKAKFIGWFIALAASSLMAGCDFDGDLTPGLVEAIYSRNESRVRELLDAGVPAGSVSANGDTPLCAALRMGLNESAIALLEHGADVNARGA